MAKRNETGERLNDGFVFPDTTWGKTTVCELDQPSEQERPVYQDGNAPGTQFKILPVRYPSFRDPYACQADTVDELLNGSQNEPPPPLSEPLCQEFCNALNDPVWHYRDCKFFAGSCFREADGFIDAGSCSWSCAGERSKWVCTDDWIEHNEPGGPPLDLFEVSGLDTPSDCGDCPTDDDGNPTACTVSCEARIDDTGDDVKQCIGESGGPGCIGEECRCPGPGCKTIPDPNGGDPKRFQSFFRHYDVTTNRGTISNAPGDVLNDTEAEVHCYGFYDEFDPKLRATVTNDKRCIIGNFFGSDGEEVDPLNLFTTQQGTGNYSPAGLPDPLPDPRDDNFDAATDLWYQNLGGSLSFINETVFVNQYGGKLSNALENPDTAKVRSTVQNTVQKPWASGGALRAIDDTVSNGKNQLVENTGSSPGRGEARPYTQWFQQFTTSANRLFSPPIVRMVLPATWTFDLTPLSPLSAGRDPRTNSITLQTQADEDLIGTVANYLRQSLLMTLQEEPVYAVVPVGSPVEFGAMALQWRQWKEWRTRNRLPVPPETDGIIAKLEEYELQIEQVRKVRTELPRYLSQILVRQSSILFGISEWERLNLENYRTHLEAAKARRALQEQWQLVGQAAADFADETNRQWCRNDRFTVPIYSLLDPWYPGRPDLGGGTPTCDLFNTTFATSLPHICIKHRPDIVLDLSRLKILTGSIVIPVLKPVAVRIDVPTPPALEAKDVDLSAMVLPNLPGLPLISQTILDALPLTAEFSRPYTLPPAPAEDLNQPTAALAAAEMIIDGMQSAYQEFWDSIIPSSRTRNLECTAYAEDECVHTEMDLLERFMRITARPGVLLQEDLEVWGQPRMPIAPNQLPSNWPLPDEAGWRKVATCEPQDYACLELNGQWQYPKDGWQIVPQKNTPSTDAALDQIRTDAREKTIDSTGKATNGQQYVVPDIRLYPVFTVPPAIPLQGTSTPKP
jgi:hypothetical protein